MLAPRTEVRRPAADHDPPDGPPAATAGLAGALVDEQVVLHRAVAFRGGVVVDRAAASHDRLGEDSPDREVEAPLVGRSQGGRRPEGVEPGGPERLVGVDVADAGHERLVQEERLQASAAGPQPAPKGTDGEGILEGLRTGPGEDRRPTGLMNRLARCGIEVVEADSPELADIAETELPAVVEGDDQADVTVERRPGRDHEQLPGHLEVDRHEGPTGQPDHELLAAASDGLDAAAGEGRPDRVGGVGAQRPRPEAHGVGDGRVEDQAAEVARDRLDLGELRHRPRR